MTLQHNHFLRYHQQPGKENPFSGSFAEAVHYDYINVHLPLERVVHGHSEILPSYEWTASYLVEVLCNEIRKENH